MLEFQTYYSHSDFSNYIDLQYEIKPQKLSKLRIKVLKTCA